MSTLLLRGTRRPVTALTVAMLVVLASLGLLIADIQPIHSHQAGQTSLYDAQCPLAALAAVHVDGPLPGPTTSGWVELAALGVVVASYRATPDSLLRLAQSRAPPTR